MKIFLLILFFVILLTGAVEVTDEDINSPLVSYLLAKVQRLEAKMMAKPNVRNTREVEKRSVDTNTSADDKKTKDCPQQVVTYIRWGNTTCPYGANTIYKGVAAGGHAGHKGAPSNMLCIHPDPMRYPNGQLGNVLAGPVEYQTSGAINHVDSGNVPCSLCEATGRGDKIMIPSRYVCPDGWHEEYNGYIMAGHYNQEGSSMYYCIDENLEQIKGSGGDHDGSDLHTVYASGAFVPRISNYALSCVVCTK